VRTLAVRRPRSLTFTIRTVKFTLLAGVRTRQRARRGVSGG
jgi:hypothetical protein